VGLKVRQATHSIFAPSVPASAAGTDLYWSLMASRRRGVETREGLRSSGGFWLCTCSFPLPFDFSTLSPCPNFLSRDDEVRRSSVLLHSSSLMSIEMAESPVESSGDRIGYQGAGCLEPLASFPGLGLSCKRREMLDLSRFMSPCISNGRTVRCRKEAECGLSKSVGMRERRQKSQDDITERM